MSSVLSQDSASSRDGSVMEKMIVEMDLMKGIAVSYVTVLLLSFVSVHSHAVS